MLLIPTLLAVCGHRTGYVGFIERTGVYTFGRARRPDPTNGFGSGLSIASGDANAFHYSASIFLTVARLDN
jgi:hypothetical protein